MRWLFVLVFAAGAAYAQEFGAITTALTDANNEARTSIVPAIAAILGVIVLITVGAAVVKAVTRTT